MIVPFLLASCGGDSHGNSQLPATPISGEPGFATPVGSPVVSPGTALALASPSASPGTAIAGPVCGKDAGTPTAAETKGLTSNGAALVVVAALNLRSGPGTDCPIAGSMGFGTTVRLDGPFLKRGGHVWRHLTGPEGSGYAVADTFQPMPVEPPTSVPILMYHRINTPASRYYVAPRELEQQVKWLKAHGYVSIVPDDLYNALYRHLPLPAKPVMLTIDDGNPSSMEFEKILTKYGFRGVYFVPNYTSLSAEQIRQLQASGEVCGHTVSHPNLATLDYGHQEQEIDDNKAWLENILGQPVTCFAYPFGTYDDVTAGILADAGYQIAFNAWGGPASLRSSDDQWHIRRIEADGGVSLDTFIGWLTAGNNG